MGVTSVVLKEEQQRNLSIGGHEEYTGKQFMELIDIAEALQERQQATDEESLDKLFSDESICEELVELGYTPEVVEKALCEFKEKQMTRWTDTEALEQIIDAYEKKCILDRDLISLDGTGYFDVTPYVLVPAGAFGVLGMVGGYITGCYLWGMRYNPEAHPALITFGPALASAVLSGVTGYFFGKRKERISKTERELRKHTIQEELKEIRQIYQSPSQQVQPADLIIVDDNGKYRTAYVKEVNALDIKVIMNYMEKKNGDSSVTWLTRLQDCPPKSIIARIQPKQYLPLQVEEAKALPLKSLLACVSEEQFSFGYLGKKTEKNFVIYSDRDCENKSDVLLYEELEQQSVKAFLLGVGE